MTYLVIGGAASAPPAPPIRPGGRGGLGGVLERDQEPAELGMRLLLEVKECPANGKKG